MNFLRGRLVARWQGESLNPRAGRAETREEWGGRFDFLMSCIGYAVGLGNVWRFPYLCYKNGGGAFLIPYMILALTSGVPLFFLEIALGQFTGQGCVTCWDICPIFKGMGYGIVILCTWLNVYYIVVLAWSLLYLASSFNVAGLPWTHCGSAWNTAACFDGNGSLPNGSVSSVTEFWRRGILDQSGGVEELGTLNPWLVAALAVAWLINYFIVWKGVKVSGKIVYFTALFPYAMLLVLLVRGVTLPGAGVGISFYLKPDFSKILNAQVWMDAGTQIFFSYAVSTGALIAMGSFNKVSNDCYKDTWIICLINSGTSFLAGFCIFSILGHLAHSSGKDVAEVVADGPGLAFIAYPAALATMDGAQAWSILFFAMLVLLGIDSQFVGLEGLFTAVLDIWPQLRQGRRPEIVMGLACFASFVFGLLMCTQGGMWVFQLFDYYSASGFVLLWFCFFECIAIAYVYGGQRFYTDIEAMIGYRISPWMLFCWAVLAPATCLVIFIVSLVSHEAISVEGVVYPRWADGLGWLLALSSMLAIPTTAVVVVATAPGVTLAQKWRHALQPIINKKKESVKHSETEFTDVKFAECDGNSLPLID